MNQGKETNEKKTQKMVEKNSANGIKMPQVKIHKWEKNSGKVEKNSGNRRKKLRKQQNDSQIGEKNSGNREKNSGNGI